MAYIPTQRPSQLNHVVGIGRYTVKCGKCGEYHWKHDLFYIGRKQFDTEGEYSEYYYLTTCQPAYLGHWRLWKCGDWANNIPQSVSQFDLRQLDAEFENRFLALIAGIAKAQKLDSQWQSVALSHALAIQQGG